MEYIKDIYGNKEQQQKCNYCISAVPVDMVRLPGIYCFVKAFILDLPPAVAYFTSFEKSYYLICF
jgi:hypothetical protein